MLNFSRPVFISGVTQGLKGFASQPLQILEQDLCRPFASPVAEPVALIPNMDNHSLTSSFSHPSIVSKIRDVAVVQHQYREWLTPTDIVPVT